MSSENHPRGTDHWLVPYLMIALGNSVDEAPSHRRLETSPSEEKVKPPPSELRAFDVETLGRLEIPDLVSSVHLGPHEERSHAALEGGEQ